MHFKNPDGETRDVYMMPRQLMIFSGEARYNWLHSISTRKIDRVQGKLKFRSRRVSLTFRKIKHTPCKCNFPKLCDSQSMSTVSCTQNQLAGEGDEAMVEKDSDAQNATDMEKKHVYEVYEKIAPHFSNTRYKPWPKIEAFLNSMPPGSLNLDVGCGNGKYLHVNAKNIVNIGTDRSFNLVDLAMEKNKGNSTFVCDSLSLPVRSNTLDSCISIAVIHHFSTVSLRVKAIKEMARVLRIGGKLLVLVWAFEQEHKKF